MFFSAKALKNESRKTNCLSSFHFNVCFGAIPYLALGAQIAAPLILIFLFFLILAPAGGYNPRGPN